MIRDLDGHAIVAEQAGDSGWYVALSPITYITRL